MYEITFGYITGATLTYGAYQPDGTPRTAAGTALTEVAGTGYYKATDASIAAGDFVIVRQGTLEVGQGQYKPEVSASGISADLTDIETKIDALILLGGQQTIIIDETGGESGNTQTFVFNEE